ncbi:MAG: HAD family hydrolase [Bacilli bacterium]|nr:HAD family hydrolase [Bacilli bacterium]
MIKRIIFDLDDTLIPWTKEYYMNFVELVKNHNISLDLQQLVHIADSIDEYENNCQNYNDENFKKLVSELSGITITDEILLLIKEWVGDCVPVSKDEKLIKTLEYLASKYELVVLTNFFYESQYKRLEKYEIAKYFKEVYGADLHSKPNKEAYFMAANGTKFEECLMIGDNKKLDYETPKKLGMDAIWLTKQEEPNEKTIKNIYELKDIL